MKRKRLTSVVKLCAQAEEETGGVDRQQIFALADVLICLCLKSL